MTSLLRRSASIVAGVALATSLAAAPMASAQTNCGTTASEQWTHWFNTLGTTYTVQHQVNEPNSAAPGGELTFATTVSGEGALINSIRQHHDVRLTPIRARVSSFKLGLVTGQTWTDETANMVRSGNTVAVNSGGWTTAGGQAATLEVTYRVPADAVAGTQYNSGAGYRAVLADGNRNYNPMNVCGTVRAANPVESAQGSLQDFGAGSLVDGSTNAGNLSSNPAGSIADIINQLDLGALLGGAIGS